MTKPFDGEAIARADREFLDSLGDHPLVRHRCTECRAHRRPTSGRSTRRTRCRRRREWPSMLTS